MRAALIEVTCRASKQALMQYYIYTRNLKTYGQVRCSSFSVTIFVSTWHYVHFYLFIKKLILLLLNYYSRAPKK